KKNASSEIQHEANRTKAIIAGFGVGILTGFLGVGGGFLIVPALVFFGGLQMKEAIGTSLLVIAMNCVAGLIGHATQTKFDWSLTFLVMGLAVGGTIFGTILSHRLAAHRLQKVFAVLVLGVALFLFAKNYTVFVLKTGQNRLQ
ncbi:MAG: sulfite exporter TauE/SafE family protein, partial [Blastocatellia bacterium]|nr:sulfite exporter TauE/SafE family protein [Blastocatellia bacterium]